MKIDVKEIPEDRPLDVDVSDDGEVLNSFFSEGLEEDFRFISALKGSFSLSRKEGTVFLTLRAKGALRVKCSLCLKEFDYPFSDTSSLIFLPREDMVEVDGEVDGEDVEKNYYDGGLLDLSEVLKDEVSMMLPFNPRCKEDCKGLCAVCGSNLNEVECRCEKNTTGGRFDVLKNFKP